MKQHYLVRGGIAVILLFMSFYSYGQELGYEAPMTKPGSPLKSGFYQGSDITTGNPDTSHPWMHLIVARHDNVNNHHVMQIASSYSQNDRLFFRKIATSSLDERNTQWYEVATRGANKFIGVQAISGNVGIGTENPSHQLDIVGNGSKVGMRLKQKGEHADWGLILGQKSDLSGYIESSGRDLQVVSGWANRLILGSQQYNNYGGQVIIPGGNVGIGTATPDAKLTVAGNVHAREVKVTVAAGADFVFEEDYVLPSLEETEQFVRQNKHLPGIAPAAKMEAEGLELGQMNILLLQKVEELTLFIIEQNKQLQHQGKEIQVLKGKLNELSK